MVVIDMLPVIYLMLRFVRKDADKKLMQECRISKDTHPPSDRLIRVYSSSDEGNRPVLFRSSNLSLPEPYCMSCLSYGLEWVKFGTLHSSFKFAREYGDDNSGWFF